MKDRPTSKPKFNLVALRNRMVRAERELEAARKAFNDARQGVING
jgi:hypothetical protein